MVIFFFSGEDKNDHENRPSDHQDDQVPTESIDEPADHPAATDNDYPIATPTGISHIADVVHISDIADVSRRTKPDDAQKAHLIDNRAPC